MSYQSKYATPAEITKRKKQKQLTKREKEK